MYRISKSAYEPISNRILQFAGLWTTNDPGVHSWVFFFCSSVFACSSGVASAITSCAALENILHELY